MSARVPAYFERIVASYHGGNKNRCAHLGHWDALAHDDATATSSQAMLGEGFQAAQQRLDEQMILLGQIDHGQSVLDVGCGLGGLVDRVNSSWLGMSLTGLNVDPEQLEICHRIRPHHDNSLHWQEGDACELPFDDASFDRVFCIEAMFHFSSRRRFLSEVWRVLKPGGRLVTSDIVLLESSTVQQVPRFAVAALLNDGYGPWPDPWCDDGSTWSLCEALGFAELTLIDATSNTLPSYDFVIPRGFNDQHDPGDPATRAAMMLRWLHKSGALRYEYFTATKSQLSLV